VTPALFSVGFIILLLASILPLLAIYRPGRLNRRIALWLLIIGLGCMLASAITQLLSSTDAYFNLYSISPGLSLAFHLDRLAGFFIVLIAVVGICCAIYSMSYIEHNASETKRQVLTALSAFFILMMLLVVASSNMFAFIFFWEAMSIVSFFLVMYEYEKAETQRAGLFYFVMTQLSTVFLLLAFFSIFHITGSMDIQAVSDLTPLTKSLIFVALFIGFGTKAGIIPFHKWLPYAHSASPSNISALMSGVMLKVAIYGLVRFLLDVIQPELWWGILLLIFGTISAVMGVIYALKEHDIKKLLAYHSIENIGIIIVGLGLYVIFNSYNLEIQANLSLVGALFHTLNHALFKSLLFMSAGSVVHATGTRNIEAMGGLVKAMPTTATLFLIGACAISALPPLNGFASEVLIFQAYLGSFVLNNPFVEILLFVGLAAFALMSALAAACFVKAFGVVFLALPRSEAAGKAKEAPFSMLIGPALLATACVVLGIFSRQIIDHVVPGLPLIDMLPLGVLLLIILALSALILRLMRAPVRVSPTWGCGIPVQTGRMEYTASGFSEPIVTVFSSIFQTKKVLKREFADSSQSIPVRSSGGIITLKFFEERIYLPVAQMIQKIATRVSRWHNADLDTLILYAFLAIVLVILGLGWWL
jgi:hydrogenase-4 component B